MPRITLPDGSIRHFDGPVAGADIAASIGKGLAKAALAIRVDAVTRDLATTIESDASVAIVTRDSEEALELLRHDAAHVLAEAVKELYPETQITIGPAIENGFYYDFAREQPFTPDDLELMEARMREIVDRDEPISREEWDRDEAIRFFRDWGEEYKAEIIADIPSDEPVSVYRQGEWIDLCRGPHLPSTGKLGKAFKLMRISGAYWRGDSGNEMLQRVYGTAWASEKQLKAYLHMLEEAERRDHRKLGREMDLFHFQDESPGAVFWHPKGQRLFQGLIHYIRERQSAAGYVEVDTPEIMDRSLWEASGHWEAFRANMFTSQTEDGRVFALKPMNCPGHVQIFKNGPVKSHRSLPMRIAEFGKVHRYEPSGALHGLMRVRAFTQDDAHVFCTADQITQEATAMCDLILSIYRDFGFDDVRIKLADRPETRVGSDAIWDKAEAALRSRVQPQPRRGRVLRAEARVRAARRDRPRLAVRHRAGRLQPAEPPRGLLRRRGRRTSRAGDAPSRHAGLDRTLHRDPHRALRGASAAMARAPARHGVYDYLGCRRLRGRGGRGAARARLVRGGRCPQREDLLQGARALARESARHPCPRQAGGRTPRGLHAQARQPRAAGRRPRRGCRDARS